MEVEMEMHCWKSPQINEITPAFIRAQLALKPVEKTSVNPFFHSKYAGLPDCMEAVRCFLLEGIMVTQLPMPSPAGTITLDTVLAHMSGQYFKSRLTMPLAKNDPQGAGSALTYARRYALGCMTGLVTEEDDDGNSASQPNKPVLSAVSRVKPASLPESYDDKNQDETPVIIWNCGKTPEQDPKQGYRGLNIREVPKDRLEWYVENGPQDEYREKASMELDRRNEG